ncbi:MAG: ATP-binding protein [Elusimicrobia bacterium]|nr:ATP-binding protein [Elusimicrobiota bacterium]
MTELSENAALAAQETGVTVEVEVPAGLPPLPADRALLWRAFEHLLANGIKYNKPGGRLRVCAAQEAGRFVFTFADEGIGISPQDRPNIFTRFFRSAAVRDSIPGSGLGLSLVKAVVERHDGTVGVESEPGRGATFLVELPEARPR